MKSDVGTLRPGSFELAESHANDDVMPGSNEFVSVRRNQASHLILIQNVHSLVRGGSQ